MFVFARWVPQKAIVTLKHPLTVFTERSLQCWHLFFRCTTCLVKNPYLLICSPRVRRSLNLAWWVCLGRQCCAERDKSMFLYLQLRRKCRLLCFQQQPPQLDWSTVTFPLMSSGSRWQQVDVFCGCLSNARGNVIFTVCGFLVEAEVPEIKWCKKKNCMSMSCDAFSIRESSVVETLTFDLCLWRRLYISSISTGSFYKI